MASTQPTQANQTNSPFMRALGEVMSGTKHAHAVAETLVKAAVTETLGRVCLDYRLDFTTLVQKYEADVLKACCEATAGDDEFVQCEALTQKGKGRRCCRRAVMGGYCTGHLDVWKEKAEESKRLEAYAAGIPRLDAKKTLGTKVSMIAPENLCHLL
jgi:hypothetical protein